MYEHVVSEVICTVAALSVTVPPLIGSMTVGVRVHSVQMNGMAPWSPPMMLFVASQPPAGGVHRFVSCTSPPAPES